MQTNHKLAKHHATPLEHKILNEEWQNLGELLSAAEELCRWLDQGFLSPEVRKSKDRLRDATTHVREDTGVKKY